MSKILKLGFADTIEPVKDFFTEVLSVDYEIVRDDQNPDYLIFGDRNFGNTNENYHNCVKIFYTGENQRPWDYKCHYAITFDHYDTPFHYRLPLYVIYDWDNKRKGVANADTVGRNALHLFGQKRDFCSFVVKNAGSKKRNEFFHKLSEYKQVTSAGFLFNNTGYVLEGGERAVQAKLDFLPKFKFNLCFENSSHPGYATEKLYEAFMGDTVPIYWGSPTIEVDFNHKAFLNWHDYQDDDLFIEAIRKVDEDDELYMEMYGDPMFPFSFEKTKFFDMDRLRRWFGKNVYKGVING